MAAGDRWLPALVAARAAQLLELDGLTGARVRSAPEVPAVRASVDSGVFRRGHATPFVDSLRQMRHGYAAPGAAPERDGPHLLHHEATPTPRLRAARLSATPLNRLSTHSGGMRTRRSGLRPEQPTTELCPRWL